MSEAKLNKAISYLVLEVVEVSELIPMIKSVEPSAESGHVHQKRGNWPSMTRGKIEEPLSSGQLSLSISLSPCVFLHPLFYKVRVFF